jgi:hypothetical protein
MFCFIVREIQLSDAADKDKKTKDDLAAGAVYLRTAGVIIALSAYLF